MALAKSYLGHGSLLTSVTTYNFGNFLAGSAGLMVVLINAGFSEGTTRTIASVSIGGTNGTIHDQSAASTSLLVGIASRVVSSGNNNVSVTFSAGLTPTTGEGVNVEVYLLTGYASTTPYAVNKATAFTAGNSIAVSFNLPDTGAALWGVFHGGNGNAHSWSSATSDDDFGTNARAGSASIAPTTVEVAHTETVSWTTNSSVRGIVGASWSDADTLDAATQASLTLTGEPSSPSLLDAATEATLTLTGETPDSATEITAGNATLTVTGEEAAPSILDAAAAASLTFTGQTVSSQLAFAPGHVTRVDVEAFNYAAEPDVRASRASIEVFRGASGSSRVPETPRPRMVPIWSITRTPADAE